ncbi:hypothetical protein VT03_02385 [Planctomyces sp. SH-PL14]|nr:hypothetical protein VT03_02385 [Planctomyces sp. SH-PL14]
MSQAGHSMRVKRYRQTSSSAALSHEGSVRQRGGLAATTALPRERHTAPLPAGLRTRGRASSRLHRTDEGGLAPTGRRFPDLKIQCHDGGRFRLPLRGSPGFAPVFPLSRTPQVMVPDQQREARYRGLTECQRPPSADSQSRLRLKFTSTAILPARLCFLRPNVRRQPGSRGQPLAAGGTPVRNLGTQRTSPLWYRR